MLFSFFSSQVSTPWLQEVHKRHNICGYQGVPSFPLLLHCFTIISGVSH
jgi:hypothetical protein